MSWPLRQAHNCKSSHIKVTPTHFLWLQTTALEMIYFTILRSKMEQFAHK
jgi:hypothetical protein